MKLSSDQSNLKGVTNSIDVLLNDFKPMNALEAQPDEETDVHFSWNDVGALNDVKAELEKVFLWPTKVIFRCNIHYFALYLI